MKSSLDRSALGANVLHVPPASQNSNFVSLRSFLQIDFKDKVSKDIFALNVFFFCDMAAICFLKYAIKIIT